MNEDEPIKMSELPEPLTTVDHNIEGFQGFMLDTDRLLASELWALSTGEEFKAAMSLWCRAWKQSPAGSLPDDEKVLAAFSGAHARWRKVRDAALRGFVKCNDGRLYHRFLCEDVVRAANKKSERNERTKAATEARKKQRDVQRDDKQNTNVTESHRQDLSGTGQEERIEKVPQPPNFDEAVSVWNETAEAMGLPKVQRLTEPRSKALKARLSECGGIEGWRAAIGKVRDSPFLCGVNAQGWKADFDFVLQAKSFTKLMEGSYEKSRNSQTNQSISELVYQALQPTDYESGEPFGE
jgi:uncharacterized protein YdaU (DUF1376 family)